MAVTALALYASMAAAEMGPCRKDGRDSMYCGEGDGAARIVPNTTSPSHRLALAWRVNNKPPTRRPDEDDPALESLIVRVDDGAILAKAKGTYWNTGDRYAPKQYLSAAWSQNSRLLIRTAGVGSGPDSAEVFAFAADDRVTGPFDLVKVLDPAVRAQMKGVQRLEEYLLRFCYRPEPTIDDQGLIQASVFMARQDADDGPIYNLTAQATFDGDSLNAKVLSISKYEGVTISVTVH